MKKLVKLFFSIIILSVSAVSFSICDAMKLTKFDKPIKDVFSEIIMFLLSIIGGLTLLIIISGGILYMFAGANPEAQNKAKETVSKAIIGLMFVLASYAIIGIISNIGA